MERVSREQMEKVDRKVPEEYGITISRMMENAGYQIADFVRKNIAEKSITVYAGKGNNGGDVLAAARRLHIWNYNVEVVVATRKLDGIRKEELEILEDLGVSISEQSSKETKGVALEGLIGYNLEGEPRKPFDQMIEEVNSYKTVISTDIPTGLDADTGKIKGKAVKPDYTLTLAAPFLAMNEKNSGEIWVLDISIPAKAYEEFGFEGPSFEESSRTRFKS